MRMGEGLSVSPEEYGWQIWRKPLLLSCSTSMPTPYAPSCLQGYGFLCLDRGQVIAAKLAAQS
jgi:hypothetical protein